MEKGRDKGTDTLQTDKAFARKEYIERSDALKVIETANSMASSFLKATMKLCVTMDRIAAADVRPVRRGRWTGHDIGNGRLSIDDDTCSLCGSRFYQIAETGCVWHYCPNCGARMDGDGDGV